jgi:cephalosporin hydroxylase
MSRVARELLTARRLLYRSLFRRGIYGQNGDGLVDGFHKLYYDSFVFDGTWADTRWLGAPAKKCPLDLWIYQEIMAELRPDVIVECGTADGGSALFLASICELLGGGTVVSIDIEERPGRPQHARIRYLTGSSTSEEIVDDVRRRVADASTVMVILDSDHSKGHVLEELRLYSPLVTPGSYVIVEDTNLNGHPVEPEFGPGPMEALEEFLQESDDFAVDDRGAKFYLTFNPRGYLRRIR